MNNQIRATLAVIIAALLSLSTQAYAGIAIVANKNFVTSSLSIDEVRDIFLGKKLAVNNTAIKPLDQDDGPTQDKFNSDVLNKTPEQSKAYWARMIFTGKGVPPDKLGSDADILTAVQNNPLAVGYVNDSAVTSSVKVLLSLP